LAILNFDAGSPFARMITVVVEAKARKGNAPERMKPKRARVPHVEKSGGGEPQPAEGRNP
jgi:hypothetical protein